MRRLVTYLFLLIICVGVFAACDTATDPITHQDGPDQYELLQLAPANRDFKVYTIADTREYHYALCRHLNDAKTVMWKSDAIADGYTPCERCFPPPVQPKATHVYIVPGRADYHINRCPYLTDDRSLMPKAEAIEAGYVACQICGSGTLPNRTVLITKEGMESSKIYHLPGCQHLEEGIEAGTLTVIQEVRAVEQGFRSCKDCWERQQKRRARATTALIPGALVYVTETGRTESFIYHTNPNCKHLDHLSTQEKLQIATPLWSAYSDGITNLCKDHAEERHTEEGEDDD